MNVVPQYKVIGPYNYDKNFFYDRTGNSRNTNDDEPI